MTEARTIDPKRIDGIVNFMREATTYVDPNEALEAYGITDIEKFSESQLAHCLVKKGTNNPQIRELFFALNNLETPDIRLLNSDSDIFNFFMSIAGGLYYAKAVRRLIKKTDILEVKEILTPKGYEFVFEFSNSPKCAEDYPLLANFYPYFIAIGHIVLQKYLDHMSPIITLFLENKLDLKEPQVDVSHLRISNEYTIELAKRTRDYLVNLSD